MCLPCLNASSRPRWVLTCLAMACLPAWAEPGAMESSPVQWHGFASQTLVNTSDNNFFGHSDDRISTDFTELGVNAHWRGHPNWSLAGQVVSRTAGEGDDGQLRLDYGFAQYSSLWGEQDQWGLLIGKSKLPYGFHNETRDVAFTRPSILLPQSIYFDRSRDLVMGVTGMQLHGFLRLGGGDLSAQLAAGRSDVDDKNIEYAFFYSDPPGRLSSRGTVGARLEYALDGGKVRLGLGYGTMKMEFDGPAGGGFDGGQVELQPLMLSAQWNGENLSLTTEIARQKRNLKGFLPAFNQTAHSLAYYLQASYRLTPAWSLLLRRDEFYADEADRDGSNLAINHLGYSKDWTLGLRYRVNPSWMLAAEWHRVDGTFILPLADNLNLAGLKPRWDMLLLQASYRF